MPHLFFNSIRKAIKHWYLPLLVGLFFIVVSIIVFTSPMTSFVALALLFSISFLLSGIAEMIFALTNKDQLRNWGWALGFGIITTLVGVLLILDTELSMSVLAFYIGFLILFRSIASISFAVDIKRYGGRQWGSLMVFGILGAIFAFILLWNPVFAGLSIVIFTGLSIFFSGLFNIYFALQLRKIHRHAKKLSPRLKERLDQLQNDIWAEWEEVE